MALSAAELDALITDLTGQYWRLSSEYSEIADEERKDEIAETMTAIDDQLTRIEEQRQALGVLGRQEPVDCCFCRNAIFQPIISLTL